MGALSLGSGITFAPVDKSGNDWKDFDADKIRWQKAAVWYTVLLTLNPEKMTYGYCI